MEIPEYIGRYRIGEMIAKGGMATIYRAADDLIGRDVAVKVTDTSDASWGKMDSDTVMRQFNMEVRISGQLSHHNFVTVYDAGQTGPLCYLVMELMDGAPLDRIIKGQEPKLDMRGKLDILIQVARGLHHAHQRGIIHRDIKPSNIMVLKNGQAKLMDFGVAHVSEGSAIKIPEGGRPAAAGGTPYYMSPEQVNKKPVDAKSDLFSLAVVAYELLTGRKPFTGDTMFALYERILRSEPPPMQEINPAIPDKVEALVTLCLNKDPQLRPASLKSFADQLDEILNESFFAAGGETITRETLDILRRYRESFTFFFDLDNSQIYQLLQVCKVRKHRKGELIFDEGEVAREMYLIMSGQVRITKGKAGAESIVILILKRGDILGEMGIIDGGPRSASATAETDCQLLVLHQVSLLRCDDNTAGKIYRNLASILSSKLRMTSSKLDQFYRQADL